MDIDNYDHVDFQSPIDKLDFIENESIDLIYCCHALEYYDLIQLPLLLKEWRRVLKCNGVLRISVPDFAKVIKIYTEHNNLKSLLSFIYGRYQKASTGHPPIYHKIIFDEILLKNILEENGFIDFKKYDWRLTEHSNIDDYSQAYIPHMDKEHGELMSLNIEVLKN